MIKGRPAGAAGGQASIDEAGAALGENGRILVRPSGTEALGARYGRRKGQQSGRYFGKKGCRSDRVCRIIRKSQHKVDVVFASTLFCEREGEKQRYNRIASQAPELRCSRYRS